MRVIRRPRRSPGQTVALAHAVHPGLGDYTLIVGGLARG